MGTIALTSYGAGIMTLPLLSRERCVGLLRSLDEHGAWNGNHPKTRYMGGTMDGAEIISPANFPSDAPGAPWREFERLLDDSVRPMLAEHGHHLPHHRHHQLLRYEPGAKGYVHKDTDADPSGFRRYTVLVYLNDNMLGGHTYFPTQDVLIKPEAGMALLFPSALDHAGTKVHTGIKYAYAAFLGNETLMDGK